MATEKKYAEESLKTKRAREKLKKQFNELETRITPEALKEKTVEIHRWIARHAHHRVVLKNKNISLFDENQNAAKLSQRISGIAKGLESDIKSWTASLEKPSMEAIGKIMTAKKSEPTSN